MSVVIKGDSNINLDFTTGGRITGDFSNATPSSRVAFQTSTANSPTIVSILPSGTGTATALDVFNNSDPTNSAKGQFVATATSVDIRSAINASGTYVPMTFQTGGSERMRIDTAGNVGIGVTTVNGKLDVRTASDSKMIFNDGSTTGNVRLEAVNVAYSAYKPFETNGSIQLFATGGTERMRIDSSGNVGIGGNSPSAHLHVYGAGTTSNSWTNGDAAGAALLVQDSGGAPGNGGQLLFGAVQGIFAGIKGAIQNGTGPAGDLLFQTRNTSGNVLERMRIDFAGNLLVGTTSSIAGSQQVQVVNAAADSTQIRVRHSSAASGRNWRYGSDSNNTLYIINQDSTGVYLSNGNTAWIGLSDERYKDIIEPITEAASKVSSLRAVIGKFKTDEEGKRRAFLIAQDVQAVLPEAVDSSNPDRLGLAPTDVIPLLVAAIQEQQAMIEQLKADVAALKGAV